MQFKLFLYIDRIAQKIKRKYIKEVIREYIHCDHSQFTILGNVTVLNSNINMGRNVLIYPDCMFFGQGRIQIGNNVQIGNGTIIYASPAGGGNNWRQYSDSSSVLHY